MKRPEVSDLTLLHAARLIEARSGDEAAYATLLAELDEFNAQTVIDVLVWMLLTVNDNNPDLLVLPIVEVWRREIEPFILEKEAQWHHNLRP